LSSEVCKFSFLFAFIFLQLAGYPVASAVVLEHGKQLTDTCLKVIVKQSLAVSCAHSPQAIGGDFPRNLLDEVSDVLLALNTVCPDVPMPSQT
jgi:hypothetical protein